MRDVGLENELGFTHSIAMIDGNDSSVAIGQGISTAAGYTVDVGFMGDSLGSLLALIRGIDYDEHLDELLGEVDENYVENSSADEFASLVTTQVAAEIAAVPSDAINGLAQQWAEYEEELTWVESKTPSEILKILVQHCVEAQSPGKRVLIHSSE
jgi:hypothetical protein